MTLLPNLVPVRGSKVPANLHTSNIPTKDAVHYRVTAELYSLVPDASSATQELM
jgi:hypothetical protein